MTSAPNRRDILALGAGCAASFALPSLAAVARRTSLASAASSRNVVFGTAGGTELLSDLAYRDLVIEQAALLTPENALKFNALQPEQGRFDFSDAARSSTAHAAPVFRCTATL